VLHNGSSYDDDLSDDGIIYHFPDTERHAGRDAAETAVT
jgi:putative restriction endonuclease